MKRYVCGFMFSPDKLTVLLIRKTKPEWQRGLYNGVGGKIEDGETPEQAMIREFKEETGVDHRTWELVCHLTGDFDEGVEHRYEVYFYRAFSEAICLAETTTEEPVRRFLTMNDFKTVPAMLPNLRWLLPMAIHESTATGLPFMVRENSKPRF